MRRVLIVSPHFPPVNAPDHQRVRMALPYCKQLGWETVVLVIDPAQVEGMPEDAMLARTVPVDIRVERVAALPAELTRLIGLGNLAMRSLPFLLAAGNALLGSQKFDLVFFSTTQFPVMILGPRWKRKFGVPYVVDFQDPWLDDYYDRTGTPPPGGKLRHRMSRLLASQLEPRVMRDVSQVIAVSPSYVQTLRDRYPHLSPSQFTVLPFGAPEKDFDLLPTLKIKHSLFDSGDGRQHWVYVGAVGVIMATALRLLFNSIAELRKARPEQWRNVRLHFAGTSYAPAGAGRASVTPIAVECGVDDLVEEETDRVPYFETLQALTEADALLVIGSDSPSYTASKLYPYILAKRPMLSVLHHHSPAVETIRRCRAGELVTFDPAVSLASHESMTSALAKIYRQASDGETPDVDWTAFDEYGARNMTRRLCEVFDRAVKRDPART